MRRIDGLAWIDTAFSLADARGSLFDAGVGSLTDFFSGGCAVEGFATTSFVVPLITQITVPSETLSPTFTEIDSTTPASDDGTSMLALSPSSVIKGVSTAILSPTLINTAMTST